MKMLRAPLFLLLLAIFLMFAAPRGRAQEDGSFDYFYDNLKPYGEWIQVADYGLCWRPSDVDEDWAPYTDGYWAYTDAGWTWVSYEEFGDIVYHYGRWVRVEDEGWCWVPDNDWGPAWVSWRNNDEYVGWAPLPPEARFEPEVGISVWVDDTYDIGPSYYRFCRVQDFGAPVIREVCFPRSRSIACYRDTVNITNISFHSGYAFCGGPRYDYYSTRVFRPIPTLRLVRETNITNVNINIGGGRRHGFSSIQRGNALLMPAPRIRAIADRRAPVPNLQPARIVSAERVSRGWSGMKPLERDEFRLANKQQTRGATPQTTKARPVAQTELKPLPAKVITEGPAITGTSRGQGNGPGAAVSGNTGTARPGATTGQGQRPGGRGDRDDDDNVPGTAGTRGPGKGNSPNTTVHPGGLVRPPVTTGNVPSRVAPGETRGVPPVTSGVVTRPVDDDPSPRNTQNPGVVSRGKTTGPTAPITTVPPKTTGTGNAKPVRRFDDDEDGRPSPSRNGGFAPAQPTQPIQRVQPTQPIQRMQPTQPIERIQPTQPVIPSQPMQRTPVVPNNGGFKRGASNGPARVETPEVNRAPKPDYEQIQRQQAAVHQQQQAIAAQQNAAAEARQRTVQSTQAAQAADARNRAANAEAARDRAQAQAVAAQRQSAAAAAARERASQAPPRPAQVAPQGVPQRPPATSDRDSGKGKDKDKDKDDKKR